MSEKFQDYRRKRYISNSNCPFSPINVGYLINRRASVSERKEVMQCSQRPEHLTVPVLTPTPPPCWSNFFTSPTGIPVVLSKRSVSKTWVTPRWPSQQISKTIRENSFSNVWWRLPVRFPLPRGKLVVWRSDLNCCHFCSETRFDDWLCITFKLRQNDNKLICLDNSAIFWGILSQFKQRIWSQSIRKSKVLTENFAFLK